MKFRSILAGVGAFLASCGARAADALFGYMHSAGLAPAIGAMDFAQNRVTNPNQAEITRNRLYDWQLYATAGVTQMTFFSTPIGQGITSAIGAVVGSAKTRWDTNMEIGGMLPSGKSFLVESIEVHFLPGSVNTANTYTPAVIGDFTAVIADAVYGPVNDVNLIMQSGLLELNVLSKTYLQETPLYSFPPKAAIDVQASQATNSATTGVGVTQVAKGAGRAYYLEPKITLQPAVNFEVLLRWPGVVATPSGFNGRIGVVMDGVFMRASQ